MTTIKEILELDAKATAGPWCVVGGDDESCSSIGGIISESEAKRLGEVAVQYRGDFPESTQWIVVEPGVSPVQFVPEDNDELIATYRTAAPELARDLERLVSYLLISNEKDTAVSAITNELAAKWGIE